MRMTLETGYEWTKTTFYKVVRDFNQHRPRVVWGSPTCGPYSIVQNLNQRTEDQVRELELKSVAVKPRIEKVIHFLNYANSKGSVVVFEHPLTASSWQFVPAPFNFTANNYECRVDGCRLGVKIICTMSRFSNL